MYNFAIEVKRIMDFDKKRYECAGVFRIDHVKGTSIEKAYSTELHYDAGLTIAYFDKFCGSIKIEGNSTELKNGDFIILNHDEIHCVFPEKGSFCERVTLFTNESILRCFPNPSYTLFEPFKRKERGCKNLISSEDANKLGLCTLISDILHLCQKKDSVSETLAICKTVELLAVIANHLSPSFVTGTNPPENLPLINQIIKYFGDHCTEDLNCDAIAENFHISKFHMSRLFKEKTGLSPWNYVIARRILLFNDLIRENMPIETACIKCGFKNYSNFYRLYKRHTGLSPSAFRKRLAKAPNDN